MKSDLSSSIRKSNMTMKSPHPCRTGTPATTDGSLAHGPRPTAHGPPQHSHIFGAIIGTGSEAKRDQNEIRKLTGSVIKNSNGRLVIGYIYTQQQDWLVTCSHLPRSFLAVTLPNIDGVNLYQLANGSNSFLGLKPGHGSFSETHSLRKIFTQVEIRLPSEKIISFCP